MGKNKAPKEPEQIHKVAKKPGRGVQLSSQSKTIIEHVRKFFEKESQYRYQIQRKNPAKRTAQATGISRRTVDRIHRVCRV